MKTLSLGDLKSNARYKKEEWDYYRRTTPLIEVPEGIEKIGNSSFYKFIWSQTLKLPKSLKEIGDRAFMSCSQLMDIDIPEGVTKISKEAFSDCTFLRTLTVRGDLDSLGNEAFSSCGSLQSIYFGGDVKKMGKRVFAECSNLKRVSIAEHAINLRKYFTQNHPNVRIDLRCVPYELEPASEKPTAGAPSLGKELTKLQENPLPGNNEGITTPTAKDYLTDDVRPWS